MTFPQPDPPMFLYPEWESWKEAALTWIERQEHEWTADDLRDAVGECKTHWPGAVIRTAANRDLIQITGRVQRSRHKSRKGSLLPVWRTK